MRPKEIDLEEFDSYIDASWEMTFIDSNDYKYKEEIFQSISSSKIRHCFQNDL